ncbi:hypothetical protein C1645_733729 [Glomus cerebriforme]|uniref:Tail specific protease domain-containing protein n=1 Tax=Glomus cerebriforme TaxID=658196 RepID=A0A397TC59_9GLOM|nr:hypothetical protein C1645_733729 [Glomus cerebriforme]
MKLIFYILIFTLITSLVDANNNDACARISHEYKRSDKNPNFSAKYSDVKECFESFPYNKELAEKTIETLKKTLQGFYVFLSEAKEKPKQGFSFRAVDLIEELNSLLLKNYTTDYQFMTDIQNLFAELKDPHLNFNPLCYKGLFLYSQQLSLYSVINKDGMQIIKIFDDEIDNSTIDCEVTHIDGRSSMEVIKEFADTLPNSKDAGVRFNSALSGLKFTDGGNLIKTSRTSFTLRIQLPKKSSIEYSLVCKNNTSTKLTREWKIESAIYNMFNTSKDYWNKFCLINENIPLPINEFNLNGGKMISKVYNIREGKMVYQSLMAKFFILNNKKIGVVVIPNIFPSDMDLVNQMFELQRGFNILEERGIRKLVLEFSENLGGSVDLALFLIYLLFPNSIPSFNNDMVVNDLTREALILATSQSPHEYFVDITMIPPLNPSKGLARWAAETAYRITYSNSVFDIFAYKNPKTNDHFHNVKEFIGNNTYMRGGIPTKYTSKFINRYTNRLGILIKLLSGNFKKYDWKSEDIIILTNGICGSSCSLITQRMAEKYNVSTIGIGGYKDIPLSYASFPGGEVYSFDNLIFDLNNIGLLRIKSLKHLIPPPFMIRAFLSFTLKEVYDGQDNVLEFTYKPAKHRLYYDELSARDPSILWLEVAKKFMN